LRFFRAPLHWVMVLKAMTRTDIRRLCRFINEDTIVTIIETNTEDNNYLPLQDNLKRLQSAKLENGKF
jgi:agmatine deiminase